MERLTLKLERRKATLVDLCRLYQASCAVPLVADALLRHEGPGAQRLKERCARQPRGLGNRAEKGEKIVEPC